ncbi:hypothetical protein D0Z08_28885 [Nocardioides immobilis]|uniref:Uncharacterized protein n=1 Tax=Nocardioides immobilis TaxID=2049295 RepID=A0A417XT50_9ACTN|nr:hypothetical protein [Nocardioides immobilis]RHW23639.1 hypothetical protein D0Z08_28885 [Nocardioides immobilis]
MDPTTWEAAEWGAFGQVGALVVATIAGVLVWLQVRHGRQVREDQTRPYVIVDFEFRGIAVMITVSNIGTTPATDVRITFDRPLESPTQGLNANRFALFSEPIPMLAPGRKINVLFGKGPDFFPADESVPLRYVATVTYKTLDEGQRPWWHRERRPYDDPPLVLDLQPFKYTAIDRDDLHNIAEKIKGIEQIMSRWTSRGRLNVNTITQAEVSAEDVEFLEAHRAERASNQGEESAPQPRSGLRGWISKVRGREKG